MSDSPLSDVMASVKASQAVAEQRGRLVVALRVSEWLGRHAAVIPDGPFLELTAIIGRAGRPEDDA